MFSRKKGVLGGQLAGALKSGTGEPERGTWMKELLFEEEAFSGFGKNVLELSSPVHLIKPENELGAFS